MLKDKTPKESIDFMISLQCLMFYLLKQNYNGTEEIQAILEDNLPEYVNLKDNFKYFFENQIPFIVENSHGLFSTQNVVDYLNGNLDKLCYNLSPEEKAKHSLALVIQQIHVVSTKELEKCPINKIAFLNPLTFVINGAIKTNNIDKQNPI